MHSAKVLCILTTGSYASNSQLRQDPDNMKVCRQQCSAYCSDFTWDRSPGISRILQPSRLTVAYRWGKMPLYNMLEFINKNLMIKHKSYNYAILYNYNQKTMPNIWAYFTVYCFSIIHQNAIKFQQLSIFWHWFEHILFTLNYYFCISGVVPNEYQTGGIELGYWFNNDESGIIVLLTSCICSLRYSITWNFIFH